MRKTIIASNGYALAAEQISRHNQWLDLTVLARVEISSEDARHPIEQALQFSDSEGGWRASGPGPQTLALHFDTPQKVRRVLVHFRESEHDRSQEFSLHVALADGHTQEIVRQQWSFSPGGSTDEQENYLVNLDAVVSLTLHMDPDRGRNRYPATLESLRVEG